MTAEAAFNLGVNIDHGNLVYHQYPTSFRVDVTGKKGPTPGAMSASVDGTDVDLSELVTPTICVIRNLDATNFVEVGVWDGTEFYPLMEIGPGEHYPFKLSRNLGNSYGTGTATVDTTHNLRIKADTAACNVYVGAFEK